jgi:hypothetical protein
MLAIVVAAHAKTRAPQIVLNVRMVGFLDVGRRSSGRSLRPIHPPTCFPDPCSIMFRQSIGRLADGKLVGTRRMRYAFSADCDGM